MVENLIINKIINYKQDISIEKYIELCLYGEFGYYKNSKILGKEGDFITAPEISQLFGEIIGLFIYDYWQKKINQKFNLIELGPGKGTLVSDLIRITKNFKNFKNNVNIHLIEKNINLIKEQKKILSKFNLGKNVNSTLPSF